MYGIFIGFVFYGVRDEVFLCDDNVFDVAFYVGFFVFDATCRRKCDYYSAKEEKGMMQFFHLCGFEMCIILPMTKMRFIVLLNRKDFPNCNFFL